MVREGYVNKIIYQNEENAYTVFVVDTTDGDEVFVGSIPGLSEGMYIQAEGEYVHHPQYDLQFKVSTSEISMPEDREGILRFLGSGAIKGIGEVMAKRIVKKFGGDTLRIIDEEPERLAEIRGISENMASKIAVQYSETRDFRNVIMFLSKYGINVKLAMKIYNEFGDEVYNIIKDNPYKIADAIPGVGFKTADDIAMQAGISPDSDFRINSAIVYILNQSMSLGHMYLPFGMLSKKAYELIAPDASLAEFEDRVNQSILEMSMANKVVSKGDNIYTKSNYFIEINSARKLIDLKLDYDIPEDEIEEAINRVEDRSNIVLEEQQRLAVKNAVKSGVAVITGGPGTGKTTIINAIIKYFELLGEETLLAAPTGRAAKRITESTGYKATTIHRLLEFSGDPDSEGNTSMRFMKNDESPLECDGIIIDEASMIDASLFYSLLKAITPGTRLILVGDINQLPPVGAGNVLHDIIESDCFSVTTLNKIFRQAEESAIVENAHHIKNGEHILINNKSKDFFFIPKANSYEIIEECKELVANNLPNYLKISPLDIEVLTPMRHFDLGVEELNKKLQDKLNPPSRDKREKNHGDIIFREGDKVMQIKNDYKIEWNIYTSGKDGDILDQGVGVFNGDMGVIEEINEFDERITVLFDDGRIVRYEYGQLDQLEHAFAITVHKSQGSEYPAVVLPLLSGPPKLLSRNLLYTAITRAKALVVVVGNINLVNRMIDNVSEQIRFTSFSERIQEINGL